MIWIFLLIVMIVIGMIGGYKVQGERYSAGRGFFKNSEYDLDEKKNDISDYSPWEYKDMRK